MVLWEKRKYGKVKKKILLPAKESPSTLCEFSPFIYMGDTEYILWGKKATPKYN
jgi:hypothetical protein